MCDLSIFRKKLPIALAGHLAVTSERLSLIDLQFEHTMYFLKGCTRSTIHSIMHLLATLPRTASIYKFFLENKLLVVIPVDQLLVTTNPWGAWQAPSTWAVALFSAIVQLSSYRKPCSDKPPTN